MKRTSNRIANTQPKLRTNPPKIANKQNYEQTGVSDKRCSPPKVFHAFLTHFWGNFDAFLTHFGTCLFSQWTRPILTHFWRISDACILAIADAFSETTFWTILQKFGNQILFAKCHKKTIEGLLWGISGFLGGRQGLLWGKSALTTHTPLIQRVEVHPLN